MEKGERRRKAWRAVFFFFFRIETIRGHRGASGYDFRSRWLHTMVSSVHLKREIHSGDSWNLYISLLSSIFFLVEEKKL